MIDIENITASLNNIQWLAVVSSAFLIVHEGFRLWDRRKPNNTTSHIWHTFGSFVRLFLVGIFFQASHNYLTTIIFGVAFILIYSIVTAYGSGRKHWYSLSDKGIDLVIKKVLFFIDLD